MKIKRTQLEEIQSWVGTDKILILKGSRQVGKTTLLQEIELSLQKKGSETVFIHADNIQSKTILESPQKLWKYLTEYQLKDPNIFFYCFIDEFQTIPQAGLFLKNLYDTHKGKFQLIVSGSSSLEITKNTEFLTGRAISFHIPRISFREFFEHRMQKTFPSISFQDSEKLSEFYSFFRLELDMYFKEYMTFGGYPEVILLKEKNKKKNLLEAISQTYLEKDIALYFNIRNILNFNHLLQILASEVGNLLNKNNLSKILGIDNASINYYLNILEGTYIIQRLPPYYKKIRSEISKMPKMYFLDLGLRNFLLAMIEGFDQKINIGAEVENFLYMTLQENFPKKALYFYRTIAGSEIDFIVEKNYENLFLIESKWQKKVGKISAFTHFEKKYPNKNCIKIVATKDMIAFQNDTFYIPVVVFPFLDWDK